MEKQTLDQQRRVDQAKAVWWAVWWAIVVQAIWGWLTE